MRHPCASRAFVSGLFLLASAASSAAQNPPFQSELVGRFEQASSVYADVWADGDRVFLAHYGQALVDVVDLSNPASPQLLATYHLPPPDNTSSAQDVKYGDGMLFVVSEFNGANGVHIVDVRDPENPELLTTLDPEPALFETSHNCAYDSGWFFMANSQDTTIAVIDLRSYDPDAPPATINAWSYLVTVPDALFIHDITVKNGLMFCSGWDNLTVYDVSGLGSQAPVRLGSIKGMSNHSVWPTVDAQFFVTADERSGGGLRLYEFFDNGSSVTIVQRDSWQVPAAESYTIHNPVMVGDRVYSSWYQAGGLVHQLDRTSKTLQLVASYDTSSEPTGGFAGCWGVHPLLGEDRVLLSDIETGLHVVDMSAVQITFEAARPDTLAVGTTQPIVVSIQGLGNAVADTGSVTLMASVNGAAYQALPMLPIGGGQYAADLPLLNCHSVVDYYVSVLDLGAREWTNPATAPASTYSTFSAGVTPVTVLADDFQANLGWTVANTSVSAGGWVRANPTNTGGQPGGGDPDTAGSNCYVTGSSGGSIGSDDLDGGPTRLTSPQLDFSAGDGWIRYKRWFFNDNADGDTLTVEISNNNGSSWTTVETLGNENVGGWVQRAARVSDFVVPTSQVRVRFSAADQPNSSITEAAIDTFRAERFACASAALAQVRTGLNVNPNVFSSLTLPIIGMSWMTQINTTTVPGATLTYWLGFSAPFDPGLMLNFGELLIDITSEPLITNPLAPAGNLATHTLPIPGNSQFQGLEVFSQGVIFAPGTVKLTNAIDAVLEY